MWEGEREIDREKLDRKRVKAILYGCDSDKSTQALRITLPRRVDSISRKLPLTYKASTEKWLTKRVWKWKKEREIYYVLKTYELCKYLFHGDYIKVHSIRFGCATSISSPCPSRFHQNYYTFSKPNQTGDKLKFTWKQIICIASICNQNNKVFPHIIFFVYFSCTFYALNIKWHMKCVRGTVFL